MTKSKFIWAAFLFNLLSIANHVYLTFQHIQIKFGITDKKSICNLNTTFNCDTVAVSDYATLWGIPIAIWAVVTHALIGALLLIYIIHISRNPNRALRWAFFLTLFTFAVSVVMGVISSFVLKTYCLFCMAAYVLTLIEVVLLWKSMPSEPTTKEDFVSVFTDHKWIGALLVCVPVAAWFGHRILLDSYGLKQLDAVVQESVLSWQQAAVNEFKPEDGLVYYKGQGEPKMTIIEFADFLCPHCRSAAPTLDAFVQSRSNVKLVFKPFPLDGECNKDIQHKGGGLRCRLTFAVFCAEKLNQKGWEAYHWVFDHQEHVSSSNLAFDKISENIAQDLGLHLPDLKACIESDQILESVQNMAREGANAKIEGTPSIFVNGRRLDRGQFMPVLEAVYNGL